MRSRDAYLGFADDTVSVLGGRATLAPFFCDVCDSSWVSAAWYGLVGPIVIGIMNYSFSKWPHSIQDAFLEGRKLHQVSRMHQSVGGVFLPHPVPVHRFVLIGSEPYSE